MNSNRAKKHLVSILNALEQGEACCQSCRRPYFTNRIQREFSSNGAVAPFCAFLASNPQRQKTNLLKLFSEDLVLLVGTLNGVSKNMSTNCAELALGTAVCTASEINLGVVQQKSLKKYALAMLQLQRRASLRAVKIAKSKVINPS